MTVTLTDSPISKLMDSATHSVTLIPMPKGLLIYSAMRLPMGFDLPTVKRLSTVTMTHSVTAKRLDLR